MLEFLHFSIRRFTFLGAFSSSRASATNIEAPRGVPAWQQWLTPHRQVFAAFFLYAFALGGFFTRIAEIQRTLGAAEGALGLALMGTATGTMVALTFGGRLIARMGPRRVLMLLVPVMALCFAFAAWATGPLMLYLLLVPAGLAIGAVEQVVNIEADRVEHQLGRRIMNRAHAFWSFGFFGAGMVGAALAGLGVRPEWHLALVVLLVAVAVRLLLGRFVPALPRGVKKTSVGSGDVDVNTAVAAAAAVANADNTAAPVATVPRFAYPTRAIGTLVALSLSAMLMEGAAIDWSAIYMRDVFGTSAFVGALAVATGALAQGIARFVADRFVERFSPVRVVRLLLAVLGFGVLLVAAAPHPVVAFAGLALMGVGSSAIFPLAMSAAAQRTDRPAAVNVAALAQTSFVVFLVGPPMLGWVAEHFGIRNAYAVGLPLVLLGFWAAHALRPSAAEKGQAG